MIGRTFASAGPFTGVIEAVATSIGFGLVIGGFLAGLESTVKRRARRQSEERALTGGYYGGMLALLALAADILRKHFV